MDCGKKCTKLCRHADWTSPRGLNVVVATRVERIRRIRRTTAASGRIALLAEATTRVCVPASTSCSQTEMDPDPDPSLVSRGSQIILRGLGRATSTNRKNASDYCTHTAHQRPPTSQSCDDSWWMHTKRAARLFVRAPSALRTSYWCLLCCAAYRPRRGCALPRLPRSGGW